MDGRMMNLNLHDALIRRIRVRERNYAERDVTLSLDTSGAMADAKALRLVRCARLAMDDIEGCWWMGETLSRDGDLIRIEAECKTADGEARMLRAACRELYME